MPQTKKTVTTVKKTNGTDWFLVGILVLVAVMVGYGLGKIGSPGTSAKEAPMEGFLAPDFELSDSAGQKYKLSSYRGKKPVLLVIERSTCGWCRKELVDLEAAYKANQAKLEIISIGSTDTVQQIQQYVAENSITHPWLVDTQAQVMSLYAARGTPSHFLMDKKGTIVATRPGYADQAALQELIAKVI